MNDFILTVAIATYNRPHLVNKTVTEIFSKVKDHRYQIIVTDDGDNRSFFESQIYFENVQFNYYCNEPSLGTFGNVLKSIELSTSKYVFILMDRDFINVDSFTQLIDFCEENIFSFAATGLTSEKKTTGPLSINIYESEYERYYYLATQTRHHSGNIINKNYFDRIENKERYLNPNFTSFNMYYHLMFDLLTYDKGIYFNNDIVKLPSNKEVLSDKSLVSVSLKGNNKSAYFTPENRKIQFETIISHVDNSMLTFSTKEMLYLKLYKFTLIHITRVLFHLKKEEIELMRYGISEYEFSFRDSIKEWVKFNLEFNKIIESRIENHAKFKILLENFKSLVLFFK